jgi:hypothetical protein
VDCDAPPCDNAGACRSRAVPLILALTAAVIGFGLCLAGCAEGGGNCDAWNPLLIGAFCLAVIAAGIVAGALLLFRPFDGEQVYPQGWLFLFWCTAILVSVSGVVGISLAIAQVTILQPQFILTVDFMILALGIHALWILTSASPLFLPDPDDEPNQPLPARSDLAVPEVPTRYEWRVSCEGTGTVHSIMLVLVMMVAAVGCVLTGFGCADVAARMRAENEVAVCYPFMDWRSGLGVTGALVSLIYVAGFLHATNGCGRSWGPDVSILVLWWALVPASMVFTLVAAYLAIYAEPILQVAFVDTAVIFSYALGATCAGSALFMRRISLPPLACYHRPPLPEPPVARPTPSAPAIGVPPHMPNPDRGDPSLRYQVGPPNDADHAANRDEMAGVRLCCAIHVASHVCGCKRPRSGMERGLPTNCLSDAPIALSFVTMLVPILLTVLAGQNILLSLAITLAALFAVALIFLLVACAKRSAKPLRVALMVIGPNVVLVVVAIVAVGLCYMLLADQPQIGTAGAALASVAITFAALVAIGCAAFRPCFCLRSPDP